MHELSVTKTIIAELQRVASEESFTNVTKATIAIGVLTTFKKEPILQYFNILKKEDPLLAKTLLNIDMVPGRISCAECHQEREVEDEVMILCPACESADVEILQGKELIIKELSGE